MSVLTDYSVQFSTRQKFGKTLSTKNDALTAYISDYYTVDDVNRLLDGLTKVLNGQIPLAGGATQSLYLANITQSQTKIYMDYDTWENNNNITPDYTLPTSDFKAIVDAWKTYLEQ